MTPLATSLLLTMRAGRAYTASTLARLHDVPLTELDASLQVLIDGRKVRRCYNARREEAYCAVRAEPSLSPLQTAQAAEKAGDPGAPPPSIATYPVTRRLEGLLTGYGGSIDSHRALAMLVRR